MTRVAPGEANPTSAEAEQILQQKFISADHTYQLGDGVGWLLEFNPKSDQTPFTEDYHEEQLDPTEAEDEKVDEIVDMAAEGNKGPILVIGGFGTGEHAYAGARGHLHGNGREHDVYQVITDRRNKGPEIMDTHAEAVIKSLLVMQESLHDGEKITIVSHSLGGPKILLGLAKLLTDEKYENVAPGLLNSIGDIIMDASAGFDESLSSRSWPIATARITGRLAVGLARTPPRIVGKKLEQRAAKKRGEEIEQTDTAIPKGTAGEFLGYMTLALNESVGEAIMCSRDFLPLITALNETELLKDKFMMILRDKEGTVNTKKNIPKTLTRLERAGLRVITVGGYHDALSTAPDQLHDLTLAHGRSQTSDAVYTYPTPGQIKIINKSTPEYSWSQRKSIDNVGNVVKAGGGVVALAVGSGLVAVRNHHTEKRAA